MKNVRVRFAPSPTGELHIGSARTALFNFLFARHNKGKIILRIEDTDAKRTVAGSVERLIESLKWLGIGFDEGISITQNSNLTTQNHNSKLESNNHNLKQFGKFGPYIQSERLGIYQEYAEKLVEDGNAYYCFCSEERLKKMRERQVKEKRAPMYDRTCAELTQEEKQKNLDAKKTYVIRLKVPYSGTTVFDDLVRGHIEIENDTIDDQILIKSDGMPTYHLANVVDDHLMEISHVLRAEEWLPSTSKHLLLYKFFGWEPPIFGHIPLVLAPDRSKLSKRHGAVSVEEFKKSGYLSEALVNYISLLGWNPKTEKEFFTILELIQEFDVSKINKAGAIFDIEKLNHFNAHYIKNLAHEKLKELIINNSRLPKTGTGGQANLKVHSSKLYLKAENSDRIIAVIKERMVKLSDFHELSKVFFEEPKYDAKLLIFKKSTKEATLKGLKLTAYGLQHMADSDWENTDKINAKLQEIVKENNLSNGNVFWPVRVALSGLDKSPSPPEMLWVLGKNESIKRINIGVEKLQGV